MHVLHILHTCLRIALIQGAEIYTLSINFVFEFIADMDFIKIILQMIMTYHLVGSSEPLTNNRFSKVEKINSFQTADKVLKTIVSKFLTQ